MSDFLEFSRPVDVLHLPQVGGRYDLTASATERAALAKRFDLLRLDRLAAQVELAPIAAGFYRLSAAFEAEVTQACVVTFEPVTTRLEETFSLLYGTQDDQKDVLLDGDSEIVEPVEGGMIDIGEAVAQQLSLALDPFPRAPEAASQSGAIVAGEPRLDSPFAVLAKLRKAEEG
jgi:uncharacterized metal-binding protein YceD (DUF177 family)